jgi:hypothetical protein
MAVNAENRAERRNQAEDGKIAEIERTLNLLLAPGAVAELRVLGVGEYDATFFGFFDGDHRREMAAAALEFNGKAEGIYVTLNQIHPGLLARLPNQVAKAWKKDLGTSDRDVIRRFWLPVDVDPRRPKGISSTDEERAAAWAVALEIKVWMLAQGWQQPVICDSGNGYHLLFRIDYPNDNHSMNTVKGILNTLAGRYDSDKVEIDVKNYNAARIWKLHATQVCKGYPLAARPHRVSRIVNVPEGLKW